jgi:hypothetical protein
MLRCAQVGRERGKEAGLGFSVKRLATGLFEVSLSGLADQAGVWWPDYKALLAHTLHDG